MLQMCTRRFLKQPRGTADAHQRISGCAVEAHKLQAIGGLDEYQGRYGYASEAP